MGLIDKGRKYTVEQRIEELRKAIARSKDTYDNRAREEELRELEMELERYNE